MTRNQKGILYWSILALVLGFPVTFAAMLAREYYQHKRYKIDFEYDDVRRYGITISCASVIHYMVLAMIV